MARPLTGHREIFRRLQENNQAKRDRINQVRELGGLEPLEEPRHNEFTHYIEDYLGRQMLDYQRQILERATDEPLVLVTGGRPNRNYTVYTQQIMTQLAQQWETVTIDMEMPYMRTRAPKWSVGYFSSNPCAEVLQPVDWENEHWGDPRTDEGKIALRKRANMKLESNEDFAFLLREDD